MGLDVYLYQYDDFAATAAAQDEGERFSEEATAAAGSWEAARESIKAHYASLGLDEWGDDKARKRCIEINSAKHPEHAFKIGYFRSSYNSGGINSVARDLLGEDLYSVFGVDHDEYIVEPDWHAARERAVEFHRKLLDAPRLRVATIAANPFCPPPTMTAKDALACWVKQSATPSAFSDGSYSTRDGTFFCGKPLPVRAAIAGTDVLRQPCVHLVYEDEGFGWYVEAAEIVIETIDYVLAQPDIASYRMHWSG